MKLEEGAAFLAPYIEKTRSGGMLGWGRSNGRWMPDWGARQPWLQPTTCYTATDGASWRPTNAIPKRMWPPRMTGKKLHDILGEIERTWPGQGPIRLMFQDEARFGRISDTRYCWCPKPFRPMVKAMVTQEYTYAYAAVSVMDGKLDRNSIRWSICGMNYARNHSITGSSIVLMRSKTI